MNMTASVMLTGLPRDAHQALADVEAIDDGKGMTDCFHSLCSYCPFSSAPALWIIYHFTRLVPFSDVLGFASGIFIADNPSHRAPSAAPISSDSEEAGVQDKSLTEIRNGGQFSQEEAWM